MPCEVIEEIAKILAEAIKKSLKARKTLDSRGVSSDTRSIVRE
jgi:hypothetical protein